MNTVALAFLKRHESCRLAAYKDGAGRWTVGWGATGPLIGPGTQWTQAEADADLNTRLAKVETAVSLAVAPVRLSLQQEAALMSLAYNVGTFGFANSHVAAFVRARNWIAAARVWIAWDHAGGVESLGLLKRRLEEAALFLEGSA